MNNMYKLKLNKYILKLKQSGGIYICNKCSPDVGDCPFCSNIKQMGGECNPLPTDLTQNELLSQEEFNSIKPDRRYTLLSYEDDGTISKGERDGWCYDLLGLGRMLSVKINAVHPITRRKLKVEQIQDILTKYNEWIVANVGNKDLVVSDKIFDIPASITELTSARAEGRDYGDIAAIMIQRPLTPEEEELLAIEEERKAEEKSKLRLELAQAELDLARLRREVQAREYRREYPYISPSQARRARQNDDQRIGVEIAQRERLDAAIDQQRNLYRNDDNVSNLPRVSRRIGYESGLRSGEREWRRGEGE